MNVLVRARAWWFNKVPFSVTLMLLLLDGQRLTIPAAIAVVFVVLSVCAVGNFGYAINELFDVAEDARIGRDNVAARIGTGRMRLIVALSAAAAIVFASIAAGALGMELTAAALCLPVAYSMPPIRLKERKWFAVLADALAAHVYPAMLALAAAVHQGVRAPNVALIVCLAVWSAAVGLRGILSHLLHTAEQDRRGGLQTVVGDAGAVALERGIVAVLLPLEASGFVIAVLLCNTGPALWCAFALYVVYEVYKTTSGRFSVTAFRPQGQLYIPLLEESFYKAWAPIVLAIDASRADLLYALFVPAYILLFRPHLNIELARFRAVAASFRR